MYAFGQYKDHFLILDPHEIRDSRPISGDAIADIHASGCQYLQTNPCSSLSSAQACSFYLKDKADFMLWKNNIVTMQRQFGKEDFIFSLFMDGMSRTKDDSLLVDSNSN